MSTTATGYGGTGQSPTELAIGSWVGGFFLDGESAQYPVIDGIYPGIATTGPQIKQSSLSEKAGKTYEGPAAGAPQYDVGNKGETDRKINAPANAEKTVDEDWSDVGPAPKNKRQMNNYLMGFFTGQGYTKEQAAGIVGNLRHESGNYSKRAIRTQIGDGGRSIGIAQWTFGRIPKLKRFCSNGRYRKLSCQLKFLMHELKTTEKKADSCLRKIKGKGPRYVKAATVSFALNFERPRGTRARRGGCNGGTPLHISTRTKYALQAYNGFKG
jgi:hypothetical protein